VNNDEQLIYLVTPHYLTANFAPCTYALHSTLLEIGREKDTTLSTLSTLNSQLSRLSRLSRLSTLDSRLSTLSLLSQLSGLICQLLCKSKCICLISMPMKYNASEKGKSQEIKYYDYYNIVILYIIIIN
jgi:hypothetical protein